LLDVPAILEGAARLSGEGLQELDVPVGEAPGFTSGDDDRSDGRALAKHRHREDAPPAASEGDLARDQWIGEHIFDLRHGTGDDGPTGNVVRLGRPRKHPLQDVERLRRGGVMGNEVHRCAGVARDGPPAGVAKADRAGNDVSNTGWRSVGELAMTLKMSLVAVRSRLRASSSLNSRTFSIAMTAWSAKVWTSAICFSVNGRESRRATL